MLKRRREKLIKLGQRGFQNEVLQGIGQQGSRIQVSNPDGGIPERRTAESIHLCSNAGRHTRIPAGEAMTLMDSVEIPLILLLMVSVLFGVFFGAWMMMP